MKNLALLLLLLGSSVISTNLFSIDPAYAEEGSDVEENTDEEAETEEES